MNVADALVAALQRLDTEYVFGLPGSTEGPLLDALSRVESPRYILGLHENIVAAMADGYARVSGRIGVVSLHTSVGTGNAISQLMNAAVDGSSVLAIIGHKDSGIANRDGFCTIEDLPGMVRPFAKWSRQVELPELAVEDMVRAARLALTAPTGPAALVVTEDRARAPWTGALEQSVGGAFESLVGGFQPDSGTIERTASMLRSAARPLIIAGDGVSRSSAFHEVAALAEACGAVVLQEPRRSASRINFDTEHPNYCGEYDPAHPAVADADLVVALGARIFVEFEPMPRDELPAGVPFIHVHDDPTELGKRYFPDASLVGSVRATVQALHDAGAAGSSDRSASFVSEHRTRFVEDFTQARVDRAAAELSMAAASCVVDEMLPEDVIVIDEGIRSSRVLLRHLSVPRSREYHRNTGGAIGWGLPAAVGATFARPDRKVALFVGDGSALMTIQSLWTAAQHGSDVLVLVSNNRGYQAVQAAVEKHRSEPLEGPAVGAAIAGPDPDFVSLANGFGVPAVAVRTPTELRDAITKSLEAKGPMVIDMQLASRQHVGGPR